MLPRGGGYNLNSKTQAEAFDWISAGKEKKKKGLAADGYVGDQETLGRELIRRPDDDLSVYFSFLDSETAIGVGGLSPSYTLLDSYVDSLVWMYTLVSIFLFRAI